MEQTIGSSSPPDRRSRSTHRASFTNPTASRSLGRSSTPTRSARESYELDVADPDRHRGQLGSVGDEYPQEVRDLYLDTTGVTDEVRALVEQITAGLPNNYEKAKAPPATCGWTTASHTPRALARSRRAWTCHHFPFDPAANRSGYCQYYASAMVMKARFIGLPARLK